MIRASESQNEELISPPPLSQPSPAQGGSVLIFLPLLLGLILTACMVGPDYKKPEIEVSDVFANQVPRSMSSKGVEASWWQGFDDYKLNRLILLAVERNLDLSIYTARLRETYALRSEA